MTKPDLDLVAQGFRLLFHHVADERVNYHKCSKEARLIDDASDVLHTVGYVSHRGPNPNILALLKAPSQMSSFSTT